MPRVKSSMIAAVSHDSKKKAMTITFRNGSTYQADGVPKTILTRMLKVQSKGKFFNRNIKDKYPIHKLGGGAKTK